MKCTIEELWNGNIAPGEKCGMHDPEVKTLVGLMRRHSENLKKELDAQQYALVEKYIDCSGDYVCRMTELAFCEGFGLAGKLLSESLTKNI